MSERSRETVVFTACAWCNAIMGTEIAPWTGEKALTTHGLCADCLRRFRPPANPWQATHTVRESSQGGR